MSTISQSTRLGKYVNLVRRTIPDKSLAKRMKNLVIQWRSLAQKSPTTPNGVPQRITPPPPPPVSHANSTPSPLSPTHTHTSIKRQSSPPLPQQTNTHTEQHSQPLSSSSPLPPSRPTPSSSSTPAINRKRALHRLSKCPSQPQKPLPSSTVSQPAQTTTSTVTSLSSLPPPSPPLHPMQTPAIMPRSLTDDATNNCGGGEGTAIPDSLHVRLPLHSVRKTSTYIVKIPLSLVSVSSVARPQEDETTSNVMRINESKTPVITPSQVPTTASNLPASTVNDSTPVMAPTSNSNSATAKLPSSLDKGYSNSLTKPVSLVVSINRNLLRHCPHHTTTTTKHHSSVNHTSSKNVDNPSVVQSDLKSEKTEIISTLNEDSLSPRQQTLVTTTTTMNECSSSERGWTGSDGIWRRWTDPIIHTHSFAVNILPYVYVDGITEDEDDKDGSS